MRKCQRQNTLKIERFIFFVSVPFHFVLFHSFVLPSFVVVVVGGVVFSANKMRSDKNRPGK